MTTGILLCRRGRGLLPWAAVLLAALFLPRPAPAAEFELRPSITVREEYNDNFFLNEDDKVDEFITRVMPSIQFRYGAPLWTWDLKYTFDYVYYARDKRDDEILHHLTLNGLIEAVKDRVFVRVADDYGRVSLDVTRDFTRESTFRDQSNRNLLTINPYYVFRVSPLLNVTTGYTYINTWYDDEQAVDKDEHIISIEPRYELSPYVSIIGGYRFSYVDSEVNDYKRHDVYIGPRYEYFDQSFVYARVGNSWTEYIGREKTSNIYWAAGITHAFPTFTGFVEAGVDYTEDPQGTVRRSTRYLAGVRYDRERINANVSLGLTSYNNAEISVATGDLRPSSDDTDKYGATGALKYALTPNLTGTLDLTIERLERDFLDTYTSRFLGGLRFEYLLLEETRLALSYYYTDSYSPRLPGDRYENNRVFVEISKRF